MDRQQHITPVSHNQSLQTLLTGSLATWAHPPIHPPPPLVHATVLLMFHLSFLLFTSNWSFVIRYMRALSDCSCWTAPNKGTSDLNLIIWRLMEPLFSVELSWPCPLFMMWRNTVSLMGVGRVSNWFCHYNHSTLLHRYITFVSLSLPVLHQEIIELLYSLVFIQTGEAFKVRNNSAGEKSVPVAKTTEKKKKKSKAVLVWFYHHLVVIRNARTSW